MSTATVDNRSSFKSLTSINLKQLQHLTGSAKNYSIPLAVVPSSSSAVVSSSPSVQVAVAVAVDQAEVVTNDKQIF